jgi:hypothetical protein
MLRQQFKINSLAIISLFVAFSALGYNTWRNEQTEENRNIRAAGFEMLLHIGLLQRISYLAHYDKDMEQGNPRSGWVEVLVLRDLSMLMPTELQQQTQHLFDSWKENWQGLGEDESAVAAIDNAINDLRKEVLESIKKLE